MDEPSLDKQKQLAILIASTTNDLEKAALRVWIEQLLALKSSNCSASQKAKKAIALTVNSSVILPAIKIVARETKRLTWDDRGLKGRLGVGGIAVGLTFFGGQGAGIAALGTAIGVPLWVVFGAGAAFLGMLYEEITEIKSGEKASYRVIDADKKDNQ